MLSAPKDDLVPLSLPVVDCADVVGTEGAAGVGAPVGVWVPDMAREEGINWNIGSSPPACPFLARCPLVSGVIVQIESGRNVYFR